MLVEDALGRLLHLACRGHVLELVAEKAFVETMGPSKRTVIFQWFQQQLKLIEMANFEPFTADGAPLELLDVRDELIIRFKVQLNQRQPCDDYRELLEFSILCLAGFLHENSGHSYHTLLLGSDADFQNY